MIVRLPSRGPPVRGRGKLPKPTRTDERLQSKTAARRSTLRCVLETVLTDRDLDANGMAVLLMRTAPAASARLVWATLLALLLALRVLSPAGFMPAFEHGAVTIIVCPDAIDGTAPNMKMHHHAPSKHREQCPYASASSLGTLGGVFGALSDSLLFASPVLLGRTFDFIERHRRQVGPPLRAPPLTA